MKFALVILAFMAPVSVAFFLSALTLPNSTPLDASIARQVPFLTSYDDTDNDGLSNRDENLWRTDWQNPDTDGDGFLDGEEVLSGHDPRKPGPNDFIERDRNLTERLGMLFLGGASLGDIDPNDPNTFSAVGAIADEVVDEYERLAMLNQQEYDLKVVGDSQDTFDAYFRTMPFFLEERFTDALRYSEDFIQDFGSIGTEQERQLLGDEDAMHDMRTRVEFIHLEVEEIIQTLIDMPVPESMERPHRNAITILVTMLQDIDTAAELESDPLKATLATTSLISILTRSTPAFIYDFATTLSHNAQRVYDEYPEELPDDE